MRRHINPITVEVDQMNSVSSDNSVTEDVRSASPCNVLSSQDRLLLQHRIIKGIIDVIFHILFVSLVNNLIN